jgi:CSLREA domain-containing protein
LLQRILERVVFKQLRALLAPLSSSPQNAAARRRRGFVPGLEGLEGRAVPATFTVTTTLDVVNPTDGKLSLREAISAANARPGPDTIVLPAGVYRIARQMADDTNAAGDFDVNGTTLFRGAGAGKTVIDGQQIDRVFDVLGSAPHSIQVTFQGLTVRNGLADASGGGGIRVGNADLLVQDCAITGNETSGHGGGISNFARPGSGNVKISRSVVIRNVAAEGGGGVSVTADSQGHGSVLNVGGSTIRLNRATDQDSGAGGGGLLATVVKLTNSTVSDNRAVGQGGGLLAGTATLTGSTVSGNWAQIGGGLRADTATLTGSTVSGNRVTGSGGGLFAQVARLTSSTVRGNVASQGDGGGIFATTAATLIGSTVSGNHAALDGGGIDASTATLTNSTLSGNTAFEGGGLMVGDVTLTSSTVSGNMVIEAGGGIFATTATLRGSTVSGNSVTGAGGGGGISATTAKLTNSTVSGNSTRGDGGGIAASAALTLLNVTVSDNDAHTGGGVWLEKGATSSVRNSIIAGNLVDLTGAGPDVSGAFTSGGHNLIGDGSDSTGFTNGTGGDMVGTADDPIEPRLGPLAFNGGPTRTHALLAGSPAIDHGDNTNAPATDQRGVARARDGDGNGSRLVDIGAFEL